MVGRADAGRGRRGNCIGSFGCEDAANSGIGFSAVCGRSVSRIGCGVGSATRGAGAAGVSAARARASRQVGPWRGEGRLIVKVFEKARLEFGIESSDIDAIANPGLDAGRLSA